MPDSPKTINYKSQAIQARSIYYSNEHNNRIARIQQKAIRAQLTGNTKVKPIPVIGIKSR